MWRRLRSFEKCDRHPVATSCPFSIEEKKERGAGCWVLSTGSSEFDGVAKQRDVACLGRRLGWLVDGLLGFKRAIAVWLGHAVVLLGARPRKKQLPNWEEFAAAGLD